MRGSGWLLPAAALLVWIAVVAAPTLATLVPSPPGPAPGVAAGATTAIESYVAIRPVWQLFVETSVYAGGVAVIAMLFGWAPGRLLGRILSRRGFVPLATLLLLPMCLPAYAIFYMWWQSWPADSALHAWVVTNDLLPVFKRATLVTSLVCWSWPIVAWCVAGSVALVPRSRDEMLEIDGAGWSTRLADRLRTDGRGLALGGLVVFLSVFNNTSCFDLAEVFTFGNELRAKDALGASVPAMLAAALPAMAVAAVGAVIVWLLLTRRTPALAVASGPVTRTAAITTAALWTISVLMPLFLLTRNLAGGPPVGEFLDLYGIDAARSIGLAAISGAVAIPVALGLSASWLDHRRWVRRLADVQAVGWLVMALVPGTIVAIALEAAYNQPRVDFVYEHPSILVLAHLARFGFVAALLARWVAGSEPRALADLRRTDDAGTLLGFLAACRPRALAAAIGTFAIVLVLALGEVVVTAQVNPPDSNPLVMIVLSDIHYQRPQTAIFSILALAIGGLAAALLATLAWAPLMRRRGMMRALGLAATLAAAAGLGGCTGEATEGRPLNVLETFGSNGTALGQFSYPRCIAADPDREVLYIVDKTARIQRWGFDGTPQHQWRTPAKENGKPTGVSVAPDGRIFVADTHYYRVLAYDYEGNEVLRFGSYGDGPGQFIYPTHVAFGPQGRLYVSEYGGHDRIQVFTAEGAYLFEFGSLGTEVGQYNRPQSMLFDHDRGELFISDACNHRIVVTDSAGTVLRTFGSPGAGPGELHYPYGLMQLSDGSLLVCEFGNNRVQRFSVEGEPLGHFGRFGAGSDELRYPWGVAGAGSAIFVLDSGNNRVHRIRRP